MNHILNRRIINAIIKEEEETAKRYDMLGRKYGLPELIEAGKQEAHHAQIFRRIKMMAQFRK
jgi:hypothetical protein